MKLITPDNPILWAKAEPVIDILKQVRPHVKRMQDFLIKTNGLGLAAPQIGVSLRFFLWRNIAVSPIINPEIIRRSPETEVAIEGCFSFPGKWLPKSRSSEIEVTYLDELGRKQNRTMRSQFARVFQHECDHLDGINLFPREEAPVASPA